MSQGPNLIVTFLYYFSTTTLIVMLVATQGMGMSLEMGLPYQLGTLCGLVAGTIGTYFNRSATVTTAFTNRKTFIKQLEEALTQLGFSEREQLDDCTVYGKSTVRSLFSGKILVKIEENSATIVGRSSNLKRLQKLI